MTAATPQQYMATFELTNDGQAVLNDLVQTFGGPLWHTSADERARRGQGVGRRQRHDASAGAGRHHHTGDRCQRVGPQAVTAARGN